LFNFIVSARFNPYFCVYSKVEKTSKRGGKIISSDQIEQQLEDDFQREQQEKKSVTDLLKNPTKVVCLRVSTNYCKVKIVVVTISLRFFDHH